MPDRYPQRRRRGIDCASARGLLLEALDEPSALRRHRLSVDDYRRMAETGVLPPDARVELIEGGDHR